MTIEDYAENKIQAKLAYTNIQLASAQRHFKWLASQNNVDEDELNTAEGSIDFFSKELLIYKYILTLINNDRAGPK